MKILVKLALFISLSVLYSCSSEKVVDDVYFKTFDHVLTDQYIWPSGKGGILWVSNNELLLEAYIKNTEGVLDRALYQVNTNSGVYIKVVDVPDQNPFNYKYCFDGSKLHVMSAEPESLIVNDNISYEIVVRGLGKPSKHKKYSSFRCDYILSPNQERGYKPLRQGDGFIKYNWKSEQGYELLLVSEDGITSKKLIEQETPRKGSAVGMFSISDVVRNEEYYFGYSPWDSKKCTNLYWLKRDGWLLENRPLCLPEFESRSILLHDLKQAIYVEYVTVGSSNSFILIDGVTIEAEKDTGRGASGSPDGCKVAYGIGNDRRQPGKRQKLKIFNHCDYISGR